MVILRWIDVITGEFWGLGGCKGGGERVGSDVGGAEVVLGEQDFA